MRRPAGGCRCWSVKASRIAIVAVLLVVESANAPPIQTFTPDNYPQTKNHFQALIDVYNQVVFPLRETEIASSVEVEQQYPADLRAIENFFDAVEKFKKPAIYQSPAFPPVPVFEAMARHRFGLSEAHVTAIEKLQGKDEKEEAEALKVARRILWFSGKKRTLARIGNLKLPEDEFKKLKKFPHVTNIAGIWEAKLAPLFQNQNSLYHSGYTAFKGSLMRMYKKLRDYGQKPDDDELAFQWKMAGYFSFRADEIYQLIHIAIEEDLSTEPEFQNMQNLYTHISARLEHTRDYRQSAAEILENSISAALVLLINRAEMKLNPLIHAKNLNELVVASKLNKDKLVTSIIYEKKIPLFLQDGSACLAQLAALLSKSSVELSAAVRGPPGTVKKLFIAGIDYAYTVGWYIGSGVDFVASFFKDPDNRIEISQSDLKRAALDQPFSFLHENLKNAAYNVIKLKTLDSEAVCAIAEYLAARAAYLLATEYEASAKAQSKMTKCQILRIDLVRDDIRQGCIKLNKEISKDKQYDPKAKTVSLKISADPPWAAKKADQRRQSMANTCPLIDEKAKGDTKDSTQDGDSDDEPPQRGLGQKWSNLEYASGLSIAEEWQDIIVYPSGLSHGTSSKAPSICWSEDTGIFHHLAEINAELQVQLDTDAETPRNRNSG